MPPSNPDPQQAEAGPTPWELAGDERVGSETAVWRRAVGRHRTSIAAHGGNASNLEAMSLQALIEDARIIGRPHALPLPTLIEMFIRFAGILLRAHDRMVLHGAIRPEVLISGRFGDAAIAEWQATLPAQAEPGTTNQTTRRTPRAEDDLRALCDCLRQALAPHDGASTRPAPPALQRVLDRGLGPHGYREAEDLLADLLAAVPPSMHLQPDGRIATSRPGKRHRAVIGIAALIVILTVFAISRWRNQPLPAAPPPAPPDVIARFTDPSWRDHWLPRPGSGGFSVREGALSNDGSPAILVFDRTLALPLRVSFTGEIPLDSRLGDLSLIFGEGRLDDPAFTWPQADSRLPDHGRWFLFQHAAQDNTFNGITRYASSLAADQTDVLASGWSVVGFEPAPLESGRPYRFTVEVERHRVALHRDGRLVAEHHEDISLRDGTIALLLWHAGKRVSDVRIWHGGPNTEELDVGEALLLGGAFASARDSFLLATGDPRRTDRAHLLLGISESALGREEQAAKAWSGIADPLVRDRAELRRLDAWFAAAQHDRVREAIAAAWRDRPALRRDLGVKLGSCLSRTVWSNQFWAYLDLREGLLPDDALSGEIAAQMLMWRKEYQRVVDRYQRHHRHYVTALFALGEFTRAEQADPGNIELREGIAMQRGGFASLAAASPPSLQALCLLGRFDEARTAYPDHAMPRLYAGDLEAASQASGPAVLVQLATAWRQGSTSPKLRLTTEELMALGSRKEQGSLEFLAERVVRARIEDRPHDEATAWRKQLGETRWRWDEPNAWFRSMLLLPLLEAIDGRPEALVSALSDPIARRRDCFGQRLHYLAGYVRGEISATAMLDQPATVEGPAWLALAEAMSGELKGDRQRAVAGWKRLAALPRQARCLGSIHGMDELELLIAWRLEGQ
jgi:hypothetical protein